MKLNISTIFSTQKPCPEFRSESVHIASPSKYVTTVCCLMALMNVILLYFCIFACIRRRHMSVEVSLYNICLKIDNAVYFGHTLKHFSIIVFTKQDCIKIMPLSGILSHKQVLDLTSIVCDVLMLDSLKAICDFSSLDSVVQ